MYNQFHLLKTKLVKTFCGFLNKMLYSIFLITFKKSYVLRFTSVMSGLREDMIDCTTILSIWLRQMFLTPYTGKTRHVQKP